MPATDPFVLYGRYLAQTIVQRKVAGGGSTPGPSIPRIQSHKGIIPVGILGAGMTGLYAALLLASQGVPFQILEATDRIGGRCFTHYFEGGGQWDYYDVGAMRFPLPPDGDNGLHKRLKKLFDYLGVDLLEYIPRTEQGRRYYNGVNARNSNEAETFRATELEVPNPYILAGVEALATDFIERLARPLLDDFQNYRVDGWKDFKNLYDRHSTRSYLQFVHVPDKDLQNRFGIPATGLPTSVINWMETFDNSTGSYDRALTETVLDAIAFGVVGDAPEWRCIRGGTSVLPNETLRKIKELAQGIPGMPSEIVVKNAPVTSIAAHDVKFVNDTRSPLKVTAGGKHYFFSHIISTVPFTSFAVIDTFSLTISPMQRTAIRQLQYGPATKIGMRFKSPWWKADKQVGGQSSTDLPIRTVVYPSYGDNQGSNVLLASYCWTSDAEKLGNLINTKCADTTPIGGKSVIDELVLRNLAAIHEVDIEFLREQHIETHSLDWSHSPWAGGAFALFGPGQYDLLYEALNATAADNRLQWAGELLSVRHAWVVGALDSAWAAVCKYLGMNHPEKLKDFYLRWGTNDEWREKPQVLRDDDGEEESDEIPLEDNLLFQIGFTHNPQSNAPE